MPKKTPQINLRVLVYREGSVWLAHCLEMDIVAEGKNPEEASADLTDLCNFQIRTALEDGDLNSVFRPAPSELWKMFFMSAEKRKQAELKTLLKKPKTKGKHSIPSPPIERIETRELALV